MYCPAFLTHRVLGRSRRFPHQRLQASQPTVCEVPSNRRKAPSTFQELEVGYELHCRERKEKVVSTSLDS